MTKPWQFLFWLVVASALAVSARAANRITATVTAYEGDQPGPRDWAGYVAERLRADYPGTEVSVEYGARNEAGTAGEVDLEDFSALAERYWDELCSDSGNEQWD